MEQTPYILIQSKNKPDRRHNLTQEVVYIGRLPENDICIQDTASSRRHCKIEPRNKDYWVVDLASSNGTRVNSFKVKEKKLKPDDSIQIGGTSLTYIDPSSPFLPAEEKDLEKNPKGSVPAIVRSLNDSIFFKKPHSSQESGFYLLYQLGRLQVSSTHLQDLLEAGMDLLINHFEGQRGCIALWNEPQKSLTPLITKVKDPIIELACPGISASITQRALKEKKAILIHNAAHDPRFSQEKSISPFSIRSALCVPLLIQDKPLGVIYLDHLTENQGFQELDLELLTAVGNLLAATINHHQLREEFQNQVLIQSTLERFHSPDVVQTILKKTKSEGKISREVTRIPATILFSDIKGFTSLSEKIDPEEVALLLNNYLNKMTQIIFQYRGTVNKFIGDAVMAIFGAPISYDGVNAAEQAIRAAMDMQKGLKMFLEHIAPHKRFQMRIGINTGEVVAGYIGADSHLEYTVLGDSVNIASRLESLCEPGGILVGEKTHELTRDLFSFQDKGETSLKGRDRKVNTYLVTF
jgi:adenylate cyclase